MQKFIKQKTTNNKKQFIDCNSQNMNNQLNFISKVGMMNGFLVHSYNKKRNIKINIISNLFINETEDFIPPIPFKAKSATNFNKIYLIKIKKIKKKKKKKI